MGFQSSHERFQGRVIKIMVFTWGHAKLPMMTHPFTRTIVTDTPHAEWLLGRVTSIITASSEPEGVSHSLPGLVGIPRARLSATEQEAGPERARVLPGTTQHSRMALSSPWSLES